MTVARTPDDPAAQKATYTALMKFARCVRNGGHTFPVTVRATEVADVYAPIPPDIQPTTPPLTEVKCSVCGAVKGSGSLLQMIADARNHTPDAYTRWTCGCGRSATGAVCSQCGGLRPTGAGCG